MQAFKSAFGIEPKPKTKRQELEDACCDTVCPKLTYRQRLYGYGSCFGGAFLLSIGSWMRLVDLVHGNPTPFVVFFTLGNLLAIVGSLFLSGPKAQCKKMFDKTRVVATLMYFLSIVATVFCCYFEHIPDKSRVGIIVLCVIVQWTAMLWYTISFIPFAREWVCTVCTQGPRDCLRGK